ncbi:MAG: hypothetical protein ACOC2U_01885 [bacterium]
MFESLVRLFIGVAIIIILIFAFMSKNKLASVVSYTILASYALTMALGGMAGLIADVSFLNFLESFIRFLSDIVVFVELGIIIFLLFFSKYKSKDMVLKVVIIVYVLLTFLMAINIF